MTSPLWQCISRQSKKADIQDIQNRPEKGIFNLKKRGPPDVGGTTRRVLDLRGPIERAGGKHDLDELMPLR